MANSESTTTTNAGDVEPARAARPRIVFLHFSAPPVVGGVEAVISEQVRLFAEAGFPTLIVAGRKAEQTPEWLGSVEIIPEMDSENPAYLKLAKSLEQQRVPPDFPAFVQRIRSGLERVLEPADIVIAHNILTTHFNLALTAAVHELVHAGRMPRLIVWCHDVSRHVNPARPERQLHGQPWDLLRTQLPTAAYVVVSGSRRQTLASILGCPPGQIRIIPNGVDPARLLALSELGAHLADAYGLLSADLVLLMPVRITRVKNIEYGMRVTQLLKRAGLVVRLVVTGPPDPHVADIPQYYEGLQQLRNELGLREEVRFVHAGTDRHPMPLGIDEPVVSELYRLSDMVLMPSIREGFGMPVLEAALVARPVFATRIPVTQDLPDFPHLIEQDEPPESVAQRIEEWARTDSTHRQRVIARQHFTWSGIFGEQVLPLIDELEHIPTGGPA